MIELPIEWQNVIVLTLIGKLGTSSIGKGWKEKSRGQGLIMSNIWGEWVLCAPHVFFAPIILHDSNLVFQSSWL